MDLEKQKNVFGIQAEDYTKYRKPYPNELYDLFFSKLPQGSTKILDVACGTGKSTEPLYKEDLEVFGCDHDPLMIEEAQKQAALKQLPITYTVGEAEKLPYKDGYFDAVTIGTAFHWFVNEQSMQEITRVLKPGALFFVFWTMSKEDPRLNNQLLADVFKKYSWQRVPTELREQKYIATFLENHGITTVSSASIPVSFNETVEERVGLEKTNSGYGLLSEENKKSFLSDLQVALVAMVGDKPYFTSDEEILICYGYKK
jgi:ubiquinone/menaquinone biosynthesis C-methylase UbiE